MAYRLLRLAPGSYDILLNGVVIASLVRSGGTNHATWTAELLEDFPPGERPAPFMELEHTFASLEEARVWLGDAELIDARTESTYPSGELQDGTRLGRPSENPDRTGAAVCLFPSTVTHVRCDEKRRSLSIRSEP